VIPKGNTTRSGVRLKEAGDALELEYQKQKYINAII
jgi:hypothetical protein